MRYLTYFFSSSFSASSISEDDLLKIEFVGFFSSFFFKSSFWLNKNKEVLLVPVSFTSSASFLRESPFSVSVFESSVLSKSLFKIFSVVELLKYGNSGDDCRVWPDAPCIWDFSEPVKSRGKVGVFWNISE